MPDLMSTDARMGAGVLMDAVAVDVRYAPGSSRCRKRASSLNQPLRRVVLGGLGVSECS